MHDVELLVRSTWGVSFFPRATKRPKPLSAVIGTRQVEHHLLADVAAPTEQEQFSISFPKPRRAAAAAGRTYLTRRNRL